MIGATWRATRPDRPVSVDKGPESVDKPPRLWTSGARRGGFSRLTVDAPGTESRLARPDKPVIHEVSRVTSTNQAGASTPRPVVVHPWTEHDHVQRSTESTP